jgi:Tol biopolymer transport system component
VLRPQRRRSNAQTFADPAEDSGNAPDITTVTVSNDGSGTITFQVTVPNRSALASGDQIVIGVDADRNQATGSSGGLDYAIELGASGATLLCLGGSNPVAATAPTLSSSFTAGVLAVAIHRSDLNETSGFDFKIASTGDGGATVGDEAPNSGGFWSYQLTGVANAPPITRTGLIAFDSNRNRNGASDIWLMQADGTHQQQLTHISGVNAAPTWSPDGKRIAFLSTRGGRALHIYVIGANGKGLRRLTTNRDNASDPSWSPDGKRIAFVGFRAGGQQIYLMNANGSHIRRLTRSQDEVETPHWSPDGKQIAFTRHHGDHLQIWVMNADGSHQRNLAPSAANDAGPSWSPDGRQIAFVTDRGGLLLGGTIDVINIDGSSLRQLTPPEDAVKSPSWSPDGKLIAVAIGVWPNVTDIYLMNPDGTGLQALTRQTDINGEPAWQPLPR